MKDHSILHISLSRPVGSKLFLHQACAYTMCNFGHRITHLPSTIYIYPCSFALSLFTTPSKLTPIIPVIINGVAILLWVLSWDKDEFKCSGEGYCGDSLEPFALGDCELGWAFLLGLASTGSIVLAIFFGCLSLFLQKQKDS